MIPSHERQFQISIMTHPGEVHTHKTLIYGYSDTSSNKYFYSHNFPNPGVIDEMGVGWQTDEFLTISRHSLRILSAHSGKHKRIGMFARQLYLTVTSNFFFFLFIYLSSFFNIYNSDAFLFNSAFSWFVRSPTGHHYK